MELATIRNYFPDVSSEKVLQELLEYQKDLDKLVEFDMSIQFNNKGREHAAMVMAKIFEASHNRVRIFAQDFNGAISDNRLYLEKLQSFVEQPGNVVEVIFESQPNAKSKALDLLLQARQQSHDRVSIKVAHEKALTDFKHYLVDGKMIHFTIGNNKKEVFNKYRCETDTTKFIAILNFDDQDFAEQLNDMFTLVLDKQATDI